MMKKRYSIVAALFLQLMLVNFHTLANAQSVNTTTISELEGQHPIEYFKKAQSLFQQGQKDEAVFVYYVAQLRYRTYVTARPDLPQDQDPAVLSSLMATIGPSMNQYAFGDLPRLVKTLDAVLVYGSRQQDSLTPRGQYPQAHKSVRDGLIKLKSHILKNGKSIREERSANGLENRT
jgi:hypothetical protein